MLNDFWFPGISRNFPEFPGISRNFPEFPGISRNFPGIPVTDFLILRCVLHHFFGVSIMFGSYTVVTVAGCISRVVLSEERADKQAAMHTCAIQAKAEIRSLCQSESTSMQNPFYHVTSSSKKRTRHKDLVCGGGPTCPLRHRKSISQPLPHAGGLSTHAA